MIMSMPEGFEEEAYKEKLAVISGKFSSKGWTMSTDDKIASETGVNLVGELQDRFKKFAKTHEIIDWHVTQDSHPQTWSMFIRYKP